MVDSKGPQACAAKKSYPVRGREVCDSQTTVAAGSGLGVKHAMGGMQRLQHDEAMQLHGSAS